MAVTFERDKVGARSQFQSKKFTDQLLSILEGLCGMQVSPVGAGRLEASENGFILHIDLSGNANVPSRPFTGFIRNAGTSDSPEYVRIVSAKSVVFNGLPDGQWTPDNDETIDIDGIATDDPPKDTDSNWVRVIVGDVVWLEGTIDSSTFPLTCTALSIKSLGNGDSWGGGFIENDGGTSSGGTTVFKQTKFRMILFTTKADTDGVTPVIDQQYASCPLWFFNTGGADSQDSSGSGDPTTGENPGVTAGFVTPLC